MYWDQNSRPQFTGGEMEAEREVDLSQKVRAEGSVLTVGQRPYLQHKVHGLCMNNGDVHRELST